MDFKSAPNKNQLQTAWIQGCSLELTDLTGHY